jgi:hypothetical protein
LLPFSPQKWQQFPHAIQTYTAKYANFARLHFPYFTTFRNQILQNFVLILISSLREFTFFPGPKISLTRKLSIVERICGWKCVNFIHLLHLTRTISQIGFLPESLHVYTYIITW